MFAQTSGWGETGDLRRFKNEEDKEDFYIHFDDRFHEYYRDSGKSSKKAASILWQFYKDVKRDDNVLINSGEQIFGTGTITGGYTFNENLYYQHTKRIRLQLNFWEPVNAKELGLPKRVEGKICGLKPTISRLEPDDWEEITKRLYRVKSPFEGIQDFRGLGRSPVSEQEVIVLFSRVSAELNMKIDAVGTRFPDAYIRVRKGGKWVTQGCEFEKSSSDFIAHGHNPKDCDMIICWRHDGKELFKRSKYKHIRVVELRSELAEMI